MGRALLRALLVSASGLLLLAGAGATPAAASAAAASAAAAPAAVQDLAAAQEAAADECQMENPRWEITWTDADAVTMRQCGGTAGGLADDDALPVTGGATRAATGAAVALLGAGAGLFLAARRRQVRFTT